MSFFFHVYRIFSKDFNKHLSFSWQKWKLQFFFLTTRQWRKNSPLSPKNAIFFFLLNRTINRSLVAEAVKKNIMYLQHLFICLSKDDAVIGNKNESFLFLNKMPALNCSHSSPGLSSTIQSFSLINYTLLKRGQCFS